MVNPSKYVLDLFKQHKQEKANMPGGTSIPTSPSAGTPITPSYLAQLTNQNPFINSQQYIPSNTGVGTYTVYGTGGGTSNTTWISPSSHTVTLGQSLYHQPSVPSPNGLTVNVLLIDANGAPHVLTVDSAYHDLLQQISHNHQFGHLGTGLQLKQRPVMTEGDFSLDELAQAEQLIEEMDANPAQP